MKKIFFAIIIMVMTVCLCGCDSTKVQKHTVPVYSDIKVGDLYHRTYEVANYDSAVGYAVHGKVDEDVNNLLKEIVYFINQNYQVDYRCKPIETVIVQKLPEELENTQYIAYYHSEKIYITEDSCAKFNCTVDELINNDQMKGVVVHELIHYVVELNKENQKPFAYVESRGNDKYMCGQYLEEGIVDLLAKKFLLSTQNTEDSEEFEKSINNDGSLYRTIRMQVELLELADIKVIESFLKDDFRKVEKEFNKKTAKYIKNSSSDSFEIFCCLMDMAFDKNVQAIGINCTVLATFDETSKLSMYMDILSKSGVNLSEEEIKPAMH